MEAGFLASSLWFCSNKYVLHLLASSSEDNW